MTISPAGAVTGCTYVDPGDLPDDLQHASFQEYFTAKFVSSYIGEKGYDLLDWLAERSAVDNTFVMTAQLNRELVIRHWGLTKAKKLLKHFVGMAKADKHLEIINYLGVSSVGASLRTGEVTSFAGAVNTNLQVVNAIYALADDNPSSGIKFQFGGNVYGGTPFSDLEEDYRKDVRKLVNNSQLVMIPLYNDAKDGFVNDAIKALACKQIEELKIRIREFERYIKSRDKLAGFVSLAVPRKG